MLLPYVQKQVDEVLSKMTALGHPMKVASSYRSFAEQEALYAKGRTRPGSIVTNARGGESWHNYKVAADLCFTTGEAFGDTQPWALYGKTAKECGFEWGGDWATFKDRPHIQMTFGQNEFTLKKLGETAAMQLLTQLSNMPESPLEDWEEEAIKFVQDTDISKGDRPRDTMTRAEGFSLVRKLYLYMINKK